VGLGELAREPSKTPTPRSEVITRAGTTKFLDFQEAISVIPIDCSIAEYDYILDGRIEEFPPAGRFPRSSRASVVRYCAGPPKIGLTG
jgi:hypothetical protein